MYLNKILFISPNLKNTDVRPVKPVLSIQVKPKYYPLIYALSQPINHLRHRGVLTLKSEASDLSNVLDQSVLASLRELQDEGDPDIVEEVGSLFIKHSPEKVKAILEAAEKDDAKGLQLAAHSLKSSSAYIGAMRLSSPPQRSLR